MMDKIRLYELRDRELSQLPLEYFDERVESYELKKIWDRLPWNYIEYLKNNSRLCYVNYNKGLDHIDGPAPERKNCPACINDSPLHLT